MVGQACVFGRTNMLFFWNNIHIRIIEIGIKSSVLPINVGYFLPKLSGALSASVADMEGDDLACFGIQSDPYPLLIAFLSDETPHFVGFDIQGIQGYVIRAARALQVYP